METSNTFLKKKSIENPQILLENIRQWLIDEQIIAPNPQPLEYEAPNTYYGDIGFEKTTEDNSFYGKVEFIGKRTEIMHALGWDWGVDFLLPEVVRCPQCKIDLIKEIDAATFYGEGNSELDSKGMQILQDLKKGISLWESGQAVNLTCHNCGIQSPIETYDYEESLLFTNFAVIFWNWPELKTDFKDILIAKLGHEAVFIER